VTLITLLALVSGCGPAPSAGAGPMPSVGSVAPDAPSAPDASQQVPADGVSLAALGFINGPTFEFSVPRGAVITDRADQPNAVTLVLGAPGPAQIAAYYRRTLPETGFGIEQDAPGEDTLSFSGHGWRGAVTGSGSLSAVFLRPQ
jgi:hypothetical protein